MVPNVDTEQLMALVTRICQLMLIEREKGGQKSTFEIIV